MENRTLGIFFSLLHFHWVCWAGRMDGWREVMVSELSNMELLGWEGFVIGCK